MTIQIGDFAQHRAQYFTHLIKMNYKEKTIIITGGGRGIGQGITQAFVDAGANVVICGRREPDNLPANTHFISLDIRERNNAAKLIDLSLIHI